MSYLKNLFLCCFILFNAGIVAAVDCSDPQMTKSKHCFKSERITFTDPIDETVECIRGRAQAEVSCKLSSRAHAEFCQQGQALICQFCLNSSQTNQDEIANLLNIDMKTFPKFCYNLINTPKGFTKIVLTESEFNSTKEAILTQFDLVHSKLLALQKGFQEGLALVDETSDNHQSKEQQYRTNLFDLAKETNLTIVGPGGLKEKMDRLGTSNSVIRIRSELDTIENMQWNNIYFNYSSHLLNKTSIEWFIQKIEDLKISYQTISDYIRAEFIYKPQK